MSALSTVAGLLVERPHTGEKKRGMGKLERTGIALARALFCFIGVEVPLCLVYCCEGIGRHDGIYSSYRKRDIEKIFQGKVVFLRGIAKDAIDEGVGAKMGYITVDVID